MLALRPRHIGLATIVLGVLASVASTQAVRPASGGAANRARPGPVPGNPPEITTDLPPGTVIYAGQDLRFRVTASDPDGDSVSLRLLNPPPRMIFCPVTGSSPVSTTARWVTGVYSNTVGYHELVFEAQDRGARRSVTRLVVGIRVVGDGAERGILTGDVTGDGKADVVGRAWPADANGVEDSGAIYVFAGGGGLSGSQGPSATLTVPDASTDDFLGGISGGQGLLLADVTGDGILDVVAGATYANVGGVTNTGAIYIFEGGQGLSGPVSPSATLAVPGASAFDLLGDSKGQGILLADVSGDGVLDVLACATSANVGGLTNTGAVYVFAGGPGLSGAVAPAGTLGVSQTGAALGEARGQGVQLADVTGDGLLDVVAGTMYLDMGGVEDAGGVFVFAGGPGILAGSVSPTATLTVPGAQPFDYLGFCRGQGIRFADVTGDGFLDVVAGAMRADANGIADSGAVHVFAGGPTLLGSVSPRASLSVPGASAYDQLCEVSLGGRGYELSDVTGDGFVDVVAGAKYADANGVANSGAIYVFAGGPLLEGAEAPSATLTVPGAAVADGLCDASNGAVIQLLDVTGDGIRDVVSGTRYADVGGVEDAGAIYVFAGGPALSGAVPPSATLAIPDAATDDLLGQAWGQGIQVVDITDDGLLDIVAGALGVEGDRGGIYVFAGGPTLSGSVSPAATLTAPGAGLGSGGGADHQGIQLADVSGDDVLDVVAIGSGNGGAGAIYVFEGGSSLSGTLSPTASLSVPGAPILDQLGLGRGQGIQLVDVTRDGRLDVVAADYFADVNGVWDAGAVYVFAGGPSLTGSVAPIASLTVPGAQPDDQLGDAFGQGIHLSDVTGDGVPDVIGGAEFADVNGVISAGGIYVWSAPVTSPGPPSATLTVPWAVTGDRLGS